MEAIDETPQSETEIDFIPSPTKRRKIDETTLTEICQLVAKRITETGACLMLDIEPQIWWAWKQRHKVEFEQVLTRIRETKLNAMLESIEDSGDGKTYIGQDGKMQVISRADWRAHAWLVERSIAPERYGQRISDPPVHQTVNVTILAELSRLVFGEQPAIDIAASGETIAALADAGQGEVINTPSDNVVKPAPIVASDLQTNDKAIANAVSHATRKPRRKQGDRTMKTYLQG